MKTHTNKELLDLLDKILKPQHNNHDYTWWDIETAIMSSSLALGKQKPLAKNKQSDNIEYHNRCIRCKGIFWTEDAFGDKCSGCI